MFEKLKQIEKLRKIQKALEEKEIEVEEKGIKMIINGAFKVLRVELNPELSIKEQEKYLTICFNKAVEKVKSEAAKSLPSALF